MKIVINPKKNKSKEVEVNQVSEDKYYGVNSKIGIKGFVTALYQGNYIVRAGQHVTVGSGWNYFNNDSQQEIGFKSLQELLGVVIEKGFEVFEFETPKELFTWLAE